METSNDWLSDDPEKTLQILYNLHFPWLHQYVKKNAGNTADAEDIFQEALIAAWIGLNSGRFIGSSEKFGAYLRQICKHKWISHLRSANFKNMQSTGDMAAFEEIGETGVDEMQLTTAKMLRSSVAVLGDKCKKILNAFYFNRKSLAQIAKEESNTEESIKTIKYRCMMQLRKIYLEKYKRNGEV